MDHARDAADIAKGARDAEDLNVARILAQLSKDPMRVPGHVTAQDPNRNIKSASNSQDAFASIDRIHTPEGMIAESYMGPDKKLYVMFRGSEGIGLSTLIPGSQSNQDWVQTNAPNHGFHVSPADPHSSYKAPTQLVQASHYLEAMLAAHPGADVIVGGHSKGGAEATYAAAMNKNVLESRTFRVISENGDSLHLKGAFADIQAKNNGIKPTDPFFNHFEQARVESASGYHEMVSALNEKFKGGVYLGQVKNLRMPSHHEFSEGFVLPMRLTACSVVDLDAPNFVQNHGADHFEMARTEDQYIEKVFGNDFYQRHPVTIQQVLKNYTGEAKAFVHYEAQKAEKSIVQSVSSEMKSIHDSVASISLPPMVNIAQKLRLAREQKVEPLAAIPSQKPTL